MRNVIKNLIGIAFIAISVPVATGSQEPPEAKESLNDIWFASYEGGLPGLAGLNIRDAVLDEVLSGLTYPWAFEFLSEHEVLLTEIGGKLSRYHLLEKRLVEVSGLPGLAAIYPQTGLLDVEIHPQFSANRRIYFSYVELDPQTQQFFRLAVATAILDADKLIEVKPILQADPYSWSPSNFGGALEFDADGFLFVSVGNRSEDWHVSSGDRLEGKILRFNDDGSVPASNPFTADPKIDDRIYALGVRNPQGLHYDEVSGKLFETEHGPMGGDEVNVIQAGKHYGWPEITYGRDYTMDAIGSGTHKEGLEQPLFYFLPSRAISPITVYRGSMFPEWEGDLLVGALKGQHVSKLDVDQERVRSEHSFLDGLNARIRDIKVAADGSVYVLAQTGSLYRLHRVPREASEEVPQQTAVLYDLICSGCHDSGAYQAPRLTEPGDWVKVLQQPLEQTYKNTIEGYGLMPERGLCGMCTDEFLKLVVDEMLEKVQSQSGSAPVPMPEQ